MTIRGNFATVFALTVPVPSMNKEGGRRQWSLLQRSVIKQQLTIREQLATKGHVMKRGQMTSRSQITIIIGGHKTIGGQMTFRGQMTIRGDTTMSLTNTLTVTLHCQEMSLWQQDKESTSLSTRQWNSTIAKFKGSSLIFHCCCFAFTVECSN